jgi:hypothetical protein
MILGLDWLACFSPMQVHWDQRWISIPYDGTTAVLFGDAPELPVGLVIQLCMVQDSGSSSSTTIVPPAVQALVTEFAT